MLPRAITAFALSLCVSAFGQGAVVISQIYGGGGNTGATYRNDFVELFNRSSNAVDITGWSVQYAAAAGSTWQVTALTGTIQAGRYHLVQQSSGGTVGTNLPPADSAGTIFMSASAGKVALVNHATALSGTCPMPSAAIIDSVGYGAAASCYESNRAPAHSNTSSLRRADEGCTDTGDNSSDFFAGAVTPRNSSSSERSCDMVRRAYAIYEIQGTNSVSPLAGQFITTTTNIVTAMRNNGFFIQSPTADEDGDPLSSEGIFVFTSGAPSALIKVGDAVVITGVVAEFRPASDPLSRTRTQMNHGSFRIASTNNPLPAPITLTTNDTRPNGGHEQLERFEGMRVHVNSVFVVGPTDGFVNEANATAISSGVFYGVLAGLPRPFREPGIDSFEELPSGSPCCVPRFDGNPELLRIDSNGQLAATPIEVEAGMAILSLTNVVHYESRRYTLLPDPASRRHIITSFPGPTAPLPAANQITVASINLERFYDSSDDPNASDSILTPAAYSNRLHKAALLIRDVMHSPDVLGVAEVENLDVLQDIASAVSSPAYEAWLLEGNDIGGIDVGFLINTARVSVVEVRQEGRNATFTHPMTGAQSTLHDRPPLLLRAIAPDPLSDLTPPLTIIMNHLRSLIDIENPDNGAFVRAKRRAQAEYVAQLAQQCQSAGEHVIVMGDFNAFEFSDGYVDVMGTITGSPTPSNQVVLASPDLVNPNLINLIETLPQTDRYSYVFDGTAQALDHILVSQSLRPRMERFLYVRSNADFPEVNRNDPESPERISDHDAAMVYVILGTLARITSIERNANDVLLEGELPAGRMYDIERSANLEDWIKIGSAAPNQARRFSFRDLNPVSGAAFYRLRADQN